MVPIVAIIAMCLSRTDHRRGRYIKMAPAFLIYLAYLMLLANARTGVEDGAGNVLLSFWAVHSVFLLLALGMLFGGQLRMRLRQWRLVREQA